MIDPRDRTPAITFSTTTSEPVATLEGASFSYGSSTVLTDVTDRIPAGQALTLVGPDGLDKTTPTWALLGVVTASRGWMHVNGAIPDRAPRGSAGYVPQLSDLDPTFPVTVREVVQIGMYSQLSILWRLGAEACRRALEALESVGLTDRAERRFGTLSDGQQQRVLVARYMAARPRLILLDEPSNDLDQPNHEILLSITTSLKDRGIFLTIFTHDLALARETCEQTALLVGRRIVFGLCDDMFMARYADETYGDHGTARPSGPCFGAGT